jgi:hypothetical protein
MLPFDTYAFCPDDWFFGSKRRRNGQNGAT